MCKLRFGAKGPPEMQAKAYFAVRDAGFPDHLQRSLAEELTLEAKAVALQQMYEVKADPSPAMQAKAYFAVRDGLFTIVGVLHPLIRELPPEARALIHQEFYNQTPTFLGGGLVVSFASWAEKAGKADPGQGPSESE
jgi:hypothetical protein